MADKKDKTKGLGIAGAITKDNNLLNMFEDNYYPAGNFPYSYDTEVNNNPLIPRDNVFNEAAFMQPLRAAAAGVNKNQKVINSGVKQGLSGIQSLMDIVKGQSNVDIDKIINQADTEYYKYLSGVKQPGLSSNWFDKLMQEKKYNTQKTIARAQANKFLLGLLDSSLKGADTARQAIPNYANSIDKLATTAATNSPFTTLSGGLASLANAQAQLGLAGATDRSSKSSARTQEIANLIQLLYNPSEAAKAQAVSDTTNTYVDLLKSIIEANKDSDGAVSPGVKALYTQLAKRLGFDVNDLSGLFGNNIPPINEVMAAIGEQQESPQEPTSTVTTPTTNINQTPTVTQNSSPVTINRGGGFSQEFLNNIDYLLKNKGLTRY